MRYARGGMVFHVLNRGACVNRGTPYGDERWIVTTAIQLALESTQRQADGQRKRTISSACLYLLIHLNLVAVTVLTSF